MRSLLAAAVLLCLSATAAWAEAADIGSWPDTNSVPPEPASVAAHPLDDDRVLQVLAGAKDEAFNLLAHRAAVRLDDETYARLSGRTDADALPWGLRPYLVRAEDRDAIRRQRSKLEALLAPAVEKAGADPKTTAALADEDLVNALGQYLDLDPLEKQALLEHDSLRTRAEALVELLEMKIMIARTPGLSNMAH